MSFRLRNVAFFALIALGSCLYFLAREQDGRVVDAAATAVETPTRPSRRAPRKPIAVVVAPPLTQNAPDAEQSVPPDVARNRSFYNQPTLPSVETDADAAESPEIFPIAKADEPLEASAQFSVWAKFPVGSWARLRVVAQTIEDGKIVESVTETRVTLASVDFEKKRYSLRYDSTIKMGDVDHQRDAEIVEYNFWDLVAVDDEREEERPAANLVVGNRVVPCRVKRLTREFDRVRETVVVWNSPVATPGALQRETTRTVLDANGKTVASRELFVVKKATDATPLTPATREAAFSRSVGGRETNGSSFYSSAIPGGLTREIAVEVDPKDGEPLRSKTTLLDYYVASGGDAAEKGRLGGNRN